MAGTAVMVARRPVTVTPLEPLTWQEVYDSLRLAGMSMRRATRLADFITSRGVKARRN